MGVAAGGRRRSRAERQPSADGPHPSQRTHPRVIRRKNRWAPTETTSALLWILSTQAGSTYSGTLPLARRACRHGRSPFERRRLGDPKEAVGRPRRPTAVVPPRRL